MKKIIKKCSSLIGILLVLFFSINIFASELTLEETKEMLGGNPYKIAEWLGKNIKPIHDDLGFGQLPKRTFKYKKGDCEDFAILAQYFIGEKNENHIVVWHGVFREDSKYYKKYKGRKISHAVCAFKLAKSGWGIIDQDKFIQHGRTLAEIIKINCDLRRIKAEKAFIMDLLKLRRKIIKEIDLED